LDLLAELRVRATFFLIGRNVDREPELARRIDAEGHLIGNHTYDHWHWGALHRGAYWREQVKRGSEAIERVLGKRPLLFRPPIGHKTPYTMAGARLHGSAVVTWSVRAWDGIPTTPQRIVEHVVPRCGPGAIVVLHDGVEPGRQRDPSATLGAIRPLVKSLRDRKLEPTRLDELTGLRPYA
jgi:peptidoglycan/xylan/chitin deacetylase (PgdA/CDA1 family)